MAIVFIHGFTGNNIETWHTFISLIKDDTRLHGWDIYSIGFSSSLRFDIPGVWSSEADLAMLSLQFRTTLSQPPLDSYDCIAVVAHSMGGLIVQSALCDDQALEGRATHVILYGTPSLGLKKASVGSIFKPQLRDMAYGSHFITKLRTDWSSRFGDSPPFIFLAVAGELDQFVPGESSLSPFHDRFRRVVSADHASLTSPPSIEHQSYTILAGSLCGQDAAETSVDLAEVWLELRRFRQVVDTLLPNSDKLDDNALVTLALALEGLGQSSKALEILEFRKIAGTHSTDALGTLAGRLKRRWLSGRVEDDYNRSIQLYREGLEIAQKNEDIPQIFYMMINIAFLELMNLPPTSRNSISVKEYARGALLYCSKSADDVWKLSTMGEAYLMLEDIDASLLFYQRAFELAKTSPRDIASIASQAFLVAGKVLGDPAVQRLNAIFVSGSRA